MVRGKSNLVKRMTGVSLALIYRADCFLQSSQTLFVARTYDLLQDLRQFFEQFYRLSAQIFLGLPHFALS